MYVLLRIGVLVALVWGWLAYDATVRTEFAATVAMLVVVIDSLRKDLLSRDKENHDDF
jgi:hypothetical protein